MNLHFLGPCQVRNCNKPDLISLYLRSNGIRYSSLIFAEFQGKIFSLQLPICCNIWLQIIVHWRLKYRKNSKCFKHLNFILLYTPLNLFVTSSLVESSSSEVPNFEYELALESWTIKLLVNQLQTQLQN